MIDPWDYTNLAHHYPWVRRFSYEEIITFAYELSSFHPDDEQGREQCVREWKNSADILADPELTRLLTTPVEDFGPVEPPCDLEHPDPSRRLTFEQSMKLIEERYGEAIKRLGLE